MFTLWIGQSDTQRQRRQVKRSTGEHLFLNFGSFKSIAAAADGEVCERCKRGNTKEENAAKIDGHNNPRDLILRNEAPQPGGEKKKPGVVLKKKVNFSIIVSPVFPLS